MKVHLASLLVMASVMISCDHFPAVDYSEFVDIPPSGIPRDREYDFAATASDSAEVISGRHDAFIAVRYTCKCPSRSIILNLEEMSLSHERPDTIRLELQLFDGNGNPEGKGAYGIYEITDTLHKGITVPDGYTLSFSSPLPDNKTVGIKSIGLILKRQE